MPHTKSVLNPDTLREVRSVVGDRFDEMLSKFHANCEKFISGMEQAAAQGDVEQVRFNAHSLKTTTAIMGVERLSVLARNLELECIDAMEGRGSMDAAVLSEDAQEIREAYTEGAGALERAVVEEGV